MIDKVSKAELVRIAKTKGFTEAQISKMSFDELSALISNTEVKTTGTLYKGFNLLDPQSTQKTNFNANIWSTQQTSAVSNEADLGFVRTQVKPQITQQVEKPVLSAEQAQDFSIEQISANTQSALNLFLAQEDNQGLVSKGYDEIKNLLKTKLSSTRINKAIDNEVTGLNFLSQAKEKALSKREYYEQNKQRLLEMIPDFDKLSEAQKQNIKARINSLPMQGVKELQHKIAMLPNKDKPEYKQEASAMLAEFKSSTESLTFEKGGIEGQQIKTTMKVNKPNSDMNSDELISYEEVFKYERGVEYSKDNIQTFEEKKATLNFVSGAKQKYEQLKHTADDVDVTDTNVLKLYTEYFGDSKKAQEFLQNVAKEKKLNIQIDSNNNGELSIKYPDNQFYKTTLKSLLKGGVEAQEAQLNKVLNGKSYEQYQTEYATSYTTAYGTKNAEELATAYGEDQENINAKATGAVQIAGMGSMVIGGIACLIPGAQPIGAGMISVGGKMALGGMLAKTALDVVNESTRKNGMSDEAAKAIIKEAAINAGSFVVGMGAGATGAKVGANLLANGSSKLVSVVAERGVDFTISVLGDMAMIGNFNVEGNMMGVVTATAMGLKTGKSVMKNHLADEVPTVKPTELTSTEKTQLKYKYDPSDSEIEIKQPQIGDGPIIPTKAKFEEDGLIYEKSSNPFVKDRVTFEGKRLATTKSELVNQLKQLGIKKDDISSAKSNVDKLSKEEVIEISKFYTELTPEAFEKNGMNMLYQFSGTYYGKGNKVKPSSELAGLMNALSKDKNQQKYMSIVRELKEHEISDYNNVAKIIETLSKNEQLPEYTHRFYELLEGCKKDMSNSAALIENFYGIYPKTEHFDIENCIKYCKNLDGANNFLTQIKDKKLAESIDRDVVRQIIQNENTDFKTAADKIEIINAELKSNHESSFTGCLSDSNCKDFFVNTNVPIEMFKKNVEFISKLEMPSQWNKGEKTYAISRLLSCKDTEILKNNYEFLKNNVNYGESSNKFEVLRDLSLTLETKISENDFLLKETDNTADKNYFSKYSQECVMASYYIKQNSDKYNLLVEKGIIKKDLYLSKEGVAKIIKNEALSGGNYAFAQKICSDDMIDITTKKSMLNNINKINIEFAKTLYNDNIIPNGKIPNILQASAESHLPFKLDLYNANKENNLLPKNTFADALAATNGVNLEFAKLICNDIPSSNFNVKETLGKISESNINFATNTYKNQLNYRNNIELMVSNFSMHKNIKESQEKLLNNLMNKNIDKEALTRVISSKDELAKVEKYNKMLENEELGNWAVQQLNAGHDIATVEFLSKTQAKLNKEVTTDKTVNVEKADNTVATEIVKPVEYISSDSRNFENELINRGVEAKQIEFIQKACINEGNLNSEMRDVAYDLLELKVNPKEVGEILNLSKVNNEFKMEIVEDFISLKDCGLNPMLRKNIAAINNMSPNEVTSTFNPGVKKQMKAMIEKLPEEQRKLLNEKGIDTNEIVSKLENNFVKIPSTGATKMTGVKLRSKAKIVGSERIILDKYIKDVPENIWRSPEKFRAWAEEKVKTTADFDSNSSYTATTYTMINENRKAGIKEWHDYLTKESTVKDDPFAQLMVLEEITKELKPDNAAVPPKLTHELFEETFNRALENGGSFAKFFNENSRSNAIEKYSKPEETVDGIKGRWVTIPKTGIDDPKYQEHVGYVQSLSYGTNWCIRFSQAETYIQKGDISFFVDADGKTQICVRENSPGNIAEIQKRQQNATVPVPYIHVVNKFVQDKQLKGCEAEIKDAMNAKPKFDALRADIAKLQAENKYNEIFTKLGINIEQAHNGTFVLSSYTAKIGDFTLAELGVDESKLFANVSQIKGDADFSSSNLTNLSNLTSVGGKFTFEGSNVNDIRNLSLINGIRINWSK